VRNCGGTKRTKREIRRQCAWSNRKHEHEVPPYIPIFRELGGTETLIARMSRWLLRNQHDVSVLVERGDKWVQTMPNVLLFHPLMFRTVGGVEEPYSS
jgi:hypothetical protein